MLIIMIDLLFIENVPGSILRTKKSSTTWWTKSHDLSKEISRISKEMIIIPYVTRLNELQK